VALRTMKRTKPRSLGAQVDRMRGRWPEFNYRMTADGFAIWQGVVQPYQAEYEIGLFWAPASSLKPWVWLIDPGLVPRPGCTYEQIPHLLYNDERPELSGLCLFDPDGAEWSNCDLIADTTIPWAVEWLQHYEFWHFDGIWRGKSIGPESVAEIRASTVHRSEGQLADDTA